MRSIGPFLYESSDSLANAHSMPLMAHARSQVRMAQIVSERYFDAQVLSKA